MIRSVTIFAVFLLYATLAVAGYKPGDEATGFSLRNVDGKLVSTEKMGKTKGLIVVFTCNHCPFAKLYQERLNEMNTHYTPLGFPVVAISSNDADAVPEDSFEEMVKRAKEKHYNFPYLYDETQDVARAYGAVKTPQAYVLLHEGGKWIVKYTGAIDDNGKEPQKVKNHFVTDAVDALLSGREVPVAATKSVGCAIKWKTE